jgi:hypothetical protein
VNAVHHRRAVGLPVVRIVEVVVNEFTVFCTPKNAETPSQSCDFVNRDNYHRLSPVINAAYTNRVPSTLCSVKSERVIHSKRPPDHDDKNRNQW